MGGVGETPDSENVLDVDLYSEQRPENLVV